MAYEAGIVYDPTAKFDQNPPVNFPGKLCRVLYERFKAGQKGVIILSCELIDNNGKELENCVIHHAKDGAYEAACHLESERYHKIRGEINESSEHGKEFVVLVVCHSTEYPSHELACF